MKESSIELFLEKLPYYSIRLAFAILLFVIGFWLVNFIKRIIRKRMIKREVDPSIREFVIPIIDFLLKLMVILTAIATVGIEVTSFSAVLVGLAAGVGLSLQGSLSNFAGGLLIIFFKPFKVDDYIEAMSNSGTVQSISILYTTIITDNQQIVVLPNSSLLNGPIKNYSVMPTRRLDLKIGISFNEDLNKTLELMRNMLKNEPLILKDKPITVEVQEFTDSKINLVIRAFTRREDYWNVYYKMHKLAFETLAGNDIALTPTPSKMLVSEKDNKK